MDTKAKTRDNVADEYGISVKTLYRWLKKHGIEVPSRERITPLVLQRIYDKLGHPSMSNYDRKRPNMTDMDKEKSV